MTSDLLTIDCALQIGKPSIEVYEAIVDPTYMCNYFISESTGRMDSGKIIAWRFPEFEGSSHIEVIYANPNEGVAFEWENEGGIKTKVALSLESLSEDKTLVKIQESGMQNHEAGIKWLKQNTEGWANFLACLKAYLEFSINLRKGGFDFYIKA